MLFSPAAQSDTARALRAAGCVFAEDEARLLIEHAKDAAELGAIVQQRSGGLPLEHILGWAEFAGRRMAVGPGVFVPRRRTEFLVSQAAKLVKPAGIVVDLCCGSGALGAALAAKCEDIMLYAADIDPTALDYARVNIGSKGHVYEGDLYDALPGALQGRVTVLMANAPYVPTEAIEFLPSEARLYEPAFALGGGSDGLDLHRRIAAGAPSWLTPGGSILIEVSRTQVPVALQIMAGSGLVARIARSETYDATVIIAKRK